MIIASKKSIWLFLLKKDHISQVFSFQYGKNPYVTQNRPYKIKYVQLLNREKEW